MPRNSSMAGSRRGGDKSSTERGTQVPTPAPPKKRGPGRPRKRADGEKTKRTNHRGTRSQSSTEHHRALFAFAAPPSLATSTHKKDRGHRKSKRRPKAVSRFDKQTFDRAEHCRQGYGFDCPRCHAECSYDARECGDCGLECYYEAGVGVVVLKERTEGNDGGEEGRVEAVVPDDSEGGRGSSGRGEEREVGTSNARGGRGGRRRRANASMEESNDNDSDAADESKRNESDDDLEESDDDDKKPAAGERAGASGGASPVELARGNDDGGSDASDRRLTMSDDETVLASPKSPRRAGGAAGSGEEEDDDFGGDGTVDFDAAGSSPDLGNDDDGNATAGRSTLDSVLGSARGGLAGGDATNGRGSDVSDLSTFQSAAVSRGSERTDELRGELAEARRANAGLAAQTARLRGECEAARGERDAGLRREEEGRASHRRLERRVGDFEERMRDGAERLEAATRELAEANGEKSRLAARVSDLEQLYDKVSEENEALHAAKETSNEEGARQKAELEGRIRTTNRQLFEAREAAKARSGELETLRAEFRTLKTDRDVLEVQLEDTTAERDDLKAALDNAQAQIAAAERETNRVRADAQLAAASQDRTAREHDAAVARLTAENDSLRRQVAEAPVASSTLPVYTPFRRSNDLEKLQGERDDVVAQLRELKSQCDAATSERDNLAKELQQANSRAVVAARERDKRGGQVVELESKLAAVWSTQRGEIERRVDTVTGQLSHAWNAARARSGEVEKLQAEVETLRWERDALEAQLGRREASGKRLATARDDAAERLDCAGAMLAVANGRREAPQAAANSAAVEREYKATVARLKAENNALKGKLVVANSRLSTASKRTSVLLMRMRDAMDDHPDGRQVLAAAKEESGSGDGKRVSLEDAEDAVSDADSEDATSDANSETSPLPQKQGSNRARPLTSALKKSDSSSFSLASPVSGKKGTKRVSFDASIEHCGKENDGAGRKRPLTKPSVGDEPLSPSKRTKRNLAAGTVEEGKKYKRTKKSRTGGKSQSTVGDPREVEDEWCGFL